MLMDDITNTFNELISLIDPDLSGGCLPIKIKNTPTTTTSHIINVISKNQKSKIVVPVGLEPTTSSFTFVILSYLCGLYHHPRLYTLGRWTLMWFYVKSV